MRKKCLSGAALLALSGLLSGCWDRTELNQLAITSATGIDWANDKWSISYQVVIPSAISAAMTATGGGAAKLPVIVYSTEGDTIREAVMRSTLESPRRLFFSHNRVLVVSEEAVNHGLEPILDVYFRNSDARETVSVLIARGNARNILEQLMQIQIIPGDGIAETMRGEARQFSALPNVSVFGLASELTGPAKSAVLPEILVSGSPGVTTANDLNHTSLSSKLRLGNLAVIRPNKMIGWLSRKEALGVSYIRNKVDESPLPFPCKPSEEKKKSVLRIKQSSTKLKPVWSGDHFVMHIDIRAEGILQETNCPFDLNKPDTIRQMERMAASTLKGTVEDSWEATRKLRTDILGFANIVHHSYPKRWEKLKSDWPSAFEQIEVVIKVNVRISRMGLTSTSFKKLTEENGGK